MVDNRSGKIAVVDDDAAVLESFQFMLETAGFHVTTYPSAIAFLEGGETHPCCLILDQHMPLMTGLELIAKLRAKANDIPVMLVTAVLSPAIAARAAELGIEKVLEKPPTEDDLLSFVSALG
jgi:FixJ family two-component response regulator